VNDQFSFHELKDFLEFKYIQYNTPEFILSDPLQVPHTFTRKEDIELSSFLTSSIAWGKRAQIIKSAQKWMMLMDNSPFDFTMNASGNELKRLSKFVHRTLNGNDAIFLILSLRRVYAEAGGLEEVFTNAYIQKQNIKDAIAHFRHEMLKPDPTNRASKHISDINKGATAKRLNLFLMWMVRSNNTGVHFGLWKNISPSALHIPLDVHVGNISRKLGLLERKQNDWKAVSELTEALRKFDPADPTKYDFSLFGIGINENFMHV